MSDWLPNLDPARLAVEAVLFSGWFSVTNWFEVALLGLLWWVLSRG